MRVKSIAVEMTLAGVIFSLANAVYRIDLMMNRGPGQNVYTDAVILVVQPE